MLCNTVIYECVRVRCHMYGCMCVCVCVWCIRCVVAAARGDARAAGPAAAGSQVQGTAVINRYHPLHYTLLSLINV